MTESLSLPQAQKLVLLSQRLPPSQRRKPACAATLEVIEHLGYVQIDTISVVQRAHHHTLWNRNPRYQPQQLEQLLNEKRVFEYWSHAAAYLPMRDYRYSLPRKQQLLSGQQNHWYQRDERLIALIYERIRAEGPLMAKDFDHHGERSNDWYNKPAKRALEHLFMQGDLMVPKRISFHKVYDLTERVLPSGIDTSVPTAAEHANHLIRRYLEVNGLGLISEICYLLKNVKADVTAMVQQMLEAGELQQVMVAGTPYFALTGALALLSSPLQRSKLKILSPFDNLLIQRKRMQNLFGFDYLIECYVPAHKRQFGYFSLPVLWGGKLVARMDCKVDRKIAVLHIHHLVLEPSLKELDRFTKALSKELLAFMQFNACFRVELHRCSPQTAQTGLAAALKILVNQE
ncbi:winged helix-turn-helix domain-containing protein [Ferrimonas lipolytica]|uniref:Winged helix-turn-helix domain-containing protein n=1 Tax=Ferrimonas lipolytica TaxID=2724191 RepID=A0A6H1UA18_9GAMM|nr:crosslink repair DNA glycosylase YcaQ family protein [Ferrimonas lipolytica]QIZ75668.1 winged helix-turn-helix domain-containing protein [Ferrimonas lipolytica]